MAFGTTVGGAPLVKAYVGTSPTKRIYVGDKHVWPPISAKVTWIGSTVATGTANTFPTHVAGDLLVVLLVGTGTAPAGYTLVKSQTSPMPVVLAYKWATAPNTAVGTLTGATTNCVYVFRNANTSAPFGATGITSNSGLAATAPALTLTDPSGDSAVGHAFIQTGASGAWVNKIPAGFISKNQNARLASNQMIDTKTATAESSTMTHSASASWTGLAFEVVPLPAEGAVVEGPYLYAVDTVTQPNWTVDFTLRSGIPPSVNDTFMFRCATITGFDGYVGRTFSKTFPVNAYPQLECSVQDMYGDGTANADSRRTVTFFITPRPAADAATGVATAAMPAGAIKGNADSGLYHMPDDPHYDETIAEQWFTTEADAKAAGFIKYTRKPRKKKA